MEKISRGNEEAGVLSGGERRPNEGGGGAKVEGNGRGRGTGSASHDLRREKDSRRGEETTRRHRYVPSAGVYGVQSRAAAAAPLSVPCVCPSFRGYE